MNNIEEKELRRKHLEVLAILVLPLLIVLIFNVVFRSNIYELLYWVTNYPWKLWIEYLFIFLLVNSFILFRVRIYYIWNLIVLIVLVIFSIINRIKLSIRGEPLLLSDFSLIREGLNIVNYFKTSINVGIYLVAPVLIIFLFSLLIWISPWRHFSFTKRAHLKIGSAVCFLMLVLFFNMNGKLFEKMGYYYIFWDSNENYTVNGALAGTLMSFDKAKVTPPIEYSQDKIEEIINNNKINEKYQETVKKPNVIFIQSEAFWDPTLLKNVPFNKDPLPNFHELQKKSRGGHLYVPVFGGKTVNTEFEVLTGISINSLPVGSIPYQQYINKPLQSLASIYSSNGYRTTAIHSFNGWFYNRRSVYQFLGFNNFISSEFFSNSKLNGAYISDDSISEEIYHRIIETEERDFIYAVTMQNHGPYSEKKPTSGEFFIGTTQLLSEEGKNILENYVRLINDADVSLANLLIKIKQIKEPTVVVFFGDHLPLLGSDYLVYKQTDFLDGSDDFGLNEKMYQVPLLVWDNYSSERNNFERNNLKANQLGAYILNYTGVKNTFFEMINSGGTLKRDKELLEYDLLFGENYSNLNSPVRIDDYMLGKSKMHISNSYPQSIESKKLFNPINGVSALSISGKNFIEGSTIFLNGELQATTVYGSSELMSVQVDPKYFKKQGTLEVQVKLLDVRGRVLSQSNPILVPITD